MLTEQDRSTRPSRPSSLPTHVFAPEFLTLPSATSRRPPERPTSPAPGTSNPTRAATGPSCGKARA